MRYDPDLLAQIQEELAVNVEYEAFLQMLANIVTQLNAAGKPNEAQEVQSVLIMVDGLKRKILSVPNPGFSFLQYQLKRKNDEL